MDIHYKHKEALIAVFSKRLRKERKKLKLTQKQLADEIGVDVKTIGNWEKGNTLPKQVDDLLALSNMFDCDIDYLFGRQNEKTKAVADVCEATGLTAEAVKCLFDSKGTWNEDFINYFITHENFPKIEHRLTLKGPMISFIRWLREKGVYKRLYKIFVNTRTDYYGSNPHGLETIGKFNHYERFKDEVITSAEEGVFSEDEIEVFGLDEYYVEEHPGVVHTIDDGIQKIFNYLYDADNMQQEYWIINNLFQNVVEGYLQSTNITEDDLIKHFVSERKDDQE